jgi:hypothetical protein
MYQVHVKEIIKKCFVIEYKIKDLKHISYLKNKIDSSSFENTNKTNVKGKMTNWKEFTNNKVFINILNNATNNFNFFNLNKSFLAEAWGNLLKKNEEVKLHSHKDSEFCGIMYLTDNGPGTHFPEIDMVIKEEIGKIVFFSGELSHFVPKIKDKKDRYTIAFNFVQLKD